MNPGKSINRSRTNDARSSKVPIKTILWHILFGSCCYYGGLMVGISSSAAAAECFTTAAPKMEDLMDIPRKIVGVRIINNTTNESLVEAPRENTTRKHGAHDGLLVVGGIINSTTNESLVEAKHVNTKTWKQWVHDGLLLSTPTNCTQQGILDKKIFVAVVVCTRSTESWRSISDTSLHTMLLPSIEKTIISDEWNTFRVEVIVAFDKGDAFWENAAHREGLVKGLHIPVSFVSIPKKTDRKKRIPFNEACRSAYDYGADYIVRVNDDTEFITNGWITKGVRTLQAYEPANVGVAGPTCGQGNTDILTHDMVHRTHLDIFSDYYPPEFDNWWIDDWITKVYGSNRTTKLTDWEVRHHTDKHGTRYKPDRRQAELLEPALDLGSKRIQHYFDTSVLWTGELEVVAGPMQNALLLTNSNESLVEAQRNTKRKQAVHDGLLLSTLTNSTQQGVLDKNIFVEGKNFEHQAEARRQIKHNQKPFFKRRNKYLQGHHLRQKI